VCPCVPVVGLTVLGSAVVGLACLFHGVCSKILCEKSSIDYVPLVEVGTVLVEEWDQSRRPVTKSPESPLTTIPFH
jgi:hypothetical protein